MRKLLLSILFLIPLLAMSQRVIINEFLAQNTSGLRDEDGEQSDWIELYNISDEDISLAGWGITDDETRPTKWVFPDVNLPKGAYLLIFATDKNRSAANAALHTNFKLSGSGEYLGLYEPDGTLSHHYSPTFPAQRSNVSYGLFGGQYVYFTTPTPGAANVAGSMPFAPVFSAKRGFYNASFALTLTVPDAGAKIYYTLDGTRPNANNAQLYTSPLTINKTTVVSAITMNDEGVYSEIVTNSYMFISNIIAQPNNPAGYPSNWKQEKSTTNITADYGMDSRVTQHADYKNSMEEALLSLPSVNIVTNIDYLFSDKQDAENGGIYIYTGRPSAVGTDWVRPTSLEYFDPKTGLDFQLNCRLKLHGGNSRNPSNSPKHGFGVTFMSAYGPSKLKFNLFDEKTATNEFNALVFRAGYNYTWTKNDAHQQTMAQYIQDSWAKNTQQAMGHVSAHERFVHLYINGLYWGMYNISEKYDKDFFETYFGGDEEDYDVVKEQQTTVPTDGTMVAWNALKSQITNVTSNENYQKIQGRNPDGSINPAFANLLDVDNYIDYMLVNYYIGNGDWDKNNWTVARNRVRNSEGFRFFSWDAETSMLSLTDNKIMTGTAGNPTAFMQHLKKNADFKVRMADRVKKLLIDAGGALTPDENIKRYNKLAAEIEMAIIAESARWSDWYAPFLPYTKNEHWLPRKADLLNNYFPQRSDVLLSQLREAGLYPAFDAPIFSHVGGTYQAPIQLSISGVGGSVYYSVDGSDPRQNISGAIAATAKIYSTALPIDRNLQVKARTKNGSEWSAITEASYVILHPNSVEVDFARAFVVEAYPNPFVGELTLKLTLQAAALASVDVFGVDGRHVQHLHNGMLHAGTHNFNWNATQMQSGVYLARIVVDGQSHFVKLVKR